MKIEIGESLGYSYLRHVKGCWLVQANWKASEHWTREKKDADLEAMFDAVRSKFDREGRVFKQTGDAARLLKQGEIDVVGVDQEGGIHAMEVAFHESGLNYGGGSETRILKKLLRTLMVLRAYHPSDARLSIYFVSPKVNPGVQKPLEDVFDALRAEYPSVEWHLFTNRMFVERMMRPALEKSNTVADTSELFVRAAKLLELSEIPPAERSRRASSTRTTGATTHSPGTPPVAPAASSRLQPLVRDLMRTLLVRCPTLLDDADRRNLIDRSYCKDELGLRIGNLALLRRAVEGRIIAEHARYYEEDYGGFYVCSQWWRVDHSRNASNLFKFVTELAARKAEHPDVARLDPHLNALRRYLRLEEGSS